MPIHLSLHPSEKYIEKKQENSSNEDACGGSARANGVCVSVNPSLTASLKKKTKKKRREKVSVGTRTAHASRSPAASNTHLYVSAAPLAIPGRRRIHGARHGSPPLAACQCSLPGDAERRRAAATHSTGGHTGTFLTRHSHGTARRPRHPNVRDSVRGRCSLRGRGAPNSQNNTCSTSPVVMPGLSVAPKTIISGCQSQQPPGLKRLARHRHFVVTNKQCVTASRRHTLLSG